MSRELTFSMTLLLVAFGTPASAQVLDQNFDPTPIDVLATVNTINDNAQTFTVGITGTLTQIEVHVTDVPPETGDLIVDIRRTVNGVPVEDDASFLAVDTIPTGTIPGGFYTVDISSFNVQARAGDVLAIVLRSTSEVYTGTDYNWAGRQGNPYANGSRYVRSPSTGYPTWTVLTHDLGFKTYMGPPADTDGDGVIDLDDNCPYEWNLSQEDTDGPYFAEGFESGNLGNWSFTYSTDSLQSGSSCTGDWISETVTSALSGSYSAHLLAISDLNCSPWMVDAAINTTVGGLESLYVTIKFDDIQGSGGTGGSHFDVVAINAENTSQSIMYRFATTTDMGGDFPVAVSPGDQLDFAADFGQHFRDKYGFPFPGDVTVLFRSHADYAETGTGLRTRTADVRLDNIEVKTGDGVGDACDNCPAVLNPDQADSDSIVLAEAFEDTTLNDWTFTYSTNGLQSGSACAGDWLSDLSANRLVGYICARLYAQSDQNCAPWNVVAVIDRTIPDADTLTVTIKFDDIQGSGGVGGSFFEIAALNALNTSQGVIYRFSTTGDLGGDFQYTVDPGDELEFVADLAGDFQSKYATDFPGEVIIRFKSYADYAELGTGTRTADVRIDHILITSAYPDSVGDVCDNCPVIYNPGQGDWDTNGMGDLCQEIVTAITATRVEPQSFALHPAVPNPFNPTTKISYDVPAGGAHVRVEVFDVRGRLVRTLADAPTSSGRHTAVWNGRNNRGQSVASGVYFCRLLAPEFRTTRKLVLLK